MRRPECAQLLFLCLHVQERAKRADDERDALGHRWLSQVAQAKVDEVRDACVFGRRACDREHAGRRVDADHVDSRLGDRDGDASGSDCELDHRASGCECLVDVETDVLGDRATPGVVERGDLVVETHHGRLRATQTNSRLASSNGCLSNQP